MFIESCFILSSTLALSSSMKPVLKFFVEISKANPFHLVGDDGKQMKAKLAVKYQMMRRKMMAFFAFLKL